MPVMVGQVYTTSIDVTDKATGQPVTPATATVTITQVGGTLPQESHPITPAPHMSYDYLMAAEGLYRFDWMTETPGAPQTDYVTCRAFLSAVSLADTRAYLGVTDTRRDPVLQMLMASATRLAEKIVGTVVPRTFTNDWLGGDLTSSRNVVQMPHGPLISDTSIAVIQSTYAGGPVWQTADLIVNPRAGTARPRNFIPFWQGPWTGTYTGGRLVPSDNITAGILEIIWDLWGTQRWVEPDTTYPDLNQLAQFEQIEGGEYRVPGRAAELLEGERYYGFG